jgi:hypothetical protein
LIRPDVVLVLVLVLLAAGSGSPASAPSKKMKKAAHVIHQDEDMYDEGGQELDEDGAPLEFSRRRGQ